MTSVSQVKIADIDKELRKLQQESKERGKIRACLFNLIVYTQNQQRVGSFKKILSAVIQKFPCRIIFIQNDSASNEDFLYANVSSETFDDGKTSFACDQVNIQVSGKHIERVPYLVTPHIVPDLPIYLLWGEDPTSEPLVLPHFEPYASRLIFDTDCTNNLQDFSKKMLEKIDLLDYDIRDMNWGMTGPWRDVMSQVFNSVDRIDQLRDAKSILIDYNKLETEHVRHCEMQSIYLQAWLASVMEWRIKNFKVIDGEITLNYSSRGGDLEVILRPQYNEELISGAILGIEVSDANITKYELKRVESMRKVVVHISTINECLLPFTLPLPNLVRGTNFMKEIFYETTSQHYRNMLQQLTTINWNRI